MTIGGAELLVIAFFIGLIAVTIVGLIRSGQNGDMGWLAGIIAGWIVGLGWLVAIIYLAAVAPRRSQQPAAMPPHSAPGAGWHSDPLGRHEFRYWNGVNWTSDVSDQGTASSDPL